MRVRFLALEPEKFFKSAREGDGLCAEFVNFLRLEVQESQAHGPPAENPFEMSAAAATAEVFLGVQRDDRVAAFPDSFAGRIAAKPHAVAQRPHAHELV